MLLVCPASAYAAAGAGYNGPTRKLEAAFHAALSERVDSDDGCYPAPDRIAGAIRKRTKVRADVAAGLNSVRQTNVVFVIKRRTACERVILALRGKGRMFVLNSARGPVRVHGRNRSSPGRAGKLRRVTVVNRTFRLSRPDELERLTVRCPGRTQPLGGGMTGAPPPGPDGEGIYPHSYERLGVQRGWHVSVVLLDPSHAATTPRRATIQVICARGIRAANPTPHRTVFVRPGETRSAIARCPRGQFLFSGGFQRTNFGSPGGSYPTESRAIGPRAWRVTGHGFDDFGGELTAIAYCVRNKRPLLTEVSASTALAAGASATATTPSCPPGRRLTAGGFSSNGSHNAFFADGSVNSNRTWSASAFGYFGPVPGFTAYGYCLRG